jgi:hypothetical protein
VAAPVAAGSPPDAAWADDEPPLGSAMRREVQRLGRRARASWPIWVTGAVVVSAVMTVMNARKPPQYTATVGLLVVEGAMRQSEELSAGSLRAHMTDLAFTRPRLGELIRNHPKEFPGAAKDIEGAVEGIRERIKVDISGSDFIDERRDSDPPRSAHIAIGFTASDPQTAWQIAHALADLLIDSAMARQRAAMVREAAGAASAVESAEAQSDDTTAADKRSDVQRLKDTEARAAAARLGLRAVEEQQGVRFELIDPGQVPRPTSRASLFGDALLTLALSLLVAFSLAGAFDPRVIDASDLTGMGVPLLGRLPLLPAPPAWTPSPPRNAPDPAAAPSDDLGARV